MSDLALLVYLPADTAAPALSRLATTIAGLPGVDLTAAGPGYWAGRWHDRSTGAWMSLDVGVPPLDDDDSARTYEGWQRLPVAFGLPLSGPHWFAVEAGAWLADCFAAAPGWALRISDDANAEEPGALDRTRLLAVWEEQHAIQVSGLVAFPRLARLSSIGLWRYRRERAAGQEAAPERAWPDVAVLGLGPRATSAALWHDPHQPLALPMVEHLIVPRAGGHGLLETEQLLAVADAMPLGRAGALAVSPRPALVHLHADADLAPVAPWSMLADGEWSD